MPQLWLIIAAKFTPTNTFFFQSILLLGFEPDGEIEIDYKFFRCVDERHNFLRFWVYSRNTQFSQSVGCSQ